MKMITVLWSSKRLANVTARPFSSRTSSLETAAMFSLVGMSLGCTLMLDTSWCLRNSDPAAMFVLVPRFPRSLVLRAEPAWPSLLVHWSDFVDRGLGDHGRRLTITDSAG